MCSVFFILKMLFSFNAIFYHLLLLYFFWGDYVTLEKYYLVFRQDGKYTGSIINTKGRKMFKRE